MNFAVLDAQGVLLRKGDCPEEMLVRQLLAPGERIMAPVGPLPPSNGQWSWDESLSRFVRRALTSEELAAEKLKATTRVDQEAETARARLTTPGAGQALEYHHTEAEARRLLSDGPSAYDPAAFPMLAAELSALGAAAPSPEALAASIIEKVSALTVQLASIKEIRRTTKIEIQSCENAEQLRQVRRPVWPSP